MIRILPGDPAAFLREESSLTLDIEEIRKNMELDIPYTQYLWNQGTRFVTGDWGQSWISKESSRSIVLRRTLNSIFLALCAWSWAILFTYLGMVWMPKWLSRSWSFLLMGAPIFWIAPFLSYLLAVKLQWLSPRGSVILPALSLGILISGFWIRFFEGRVRIELLQPYYRTALSKGLSHSTVMTRHLLPNILASIAPFLGTQIGETLAGVAITEKLFDWPGLGALLIDSVYRRDFPILDDALWISVLWVYFANLAGQLLQKKLNPQKWVGI